jgi:hypothetical protein
MGAKEEELDDNRGRRRSFTTLTQERRWRQDHTIGLTYDRSRIRRTLIIAPLNQGHELVTSKAFSSLVKCSSDIQYEIALPATITVG